MYVKYIFHFVLAKFDDKSDQDKLPALMTNSNSFSSLLKQNNSKLVIKSSSLVCPDGSVSKRSHCGNYFVLLVYIVNTSS